MYRVCVCHVGQNDIARAAALSEEIIPKMCWECICYQVDAMAGDDKTAYLATPKSPGCPSHKVSFFIALDQQNDQHGYATETKIMVFTSNQSKHFISSSYMDLLQLKHHRKRTPTATYTDELAKKTYGCGDCCMLTPVEWGNPKCYFEKASTWGGSTLL